MSRSILVKALAAGWLLTILILVVLALLNRPLIDTSMMSLLPASEQKPIVKAASESMGRQFSQRLLLLVSAEDKALRQQSVNSLVEQLTDLPQVDSVIWQLKGDGISQLQDGIFPYRYALLTDDIADRIDEGETQAIRQRALARIISPIGSGRGSLISDPFGLMEPWLEQGAHDIQLVPDDGYLQLEKSPSTYLIIIQLATDAFSISTQQAVLNAYQPQLTDLEEQGVSVQSAGLLIHASAGAQQAQKEMSTIGLGSLLGIVILMLWVFRQWRAVGLLLLPIVVGCSVATAIAFLVFEQVHVVTFAFGAGLIGVAIDYALHFLCERQVRRDVIQRILPGLVLGLISSVLAYAAQALTPFPGLRQMALFSVAGLIAAWLTVVLWLPLLTRGNFVSNTQAADILISWQRRLPSLATHPRSIRLLLTLLTVMALWLIYSGQAEDDIRLLQTSPPALLEQEQRVQELLSYNSSTQFLLLPCQNLQSCLEQEHAIKPSLDILQEKGLITRYRLVSNEIPALERQQENIARTADLYQTELEALFNTLNLPASMRQTAMDRFYADADNRLLPEKQHGSLFSSGSSQIITGLAGQKATVISFASYRNLTNADIEPLKLYAPEIMLVDQVSAISNLMQKYRQQLSVWVSLAYFFVFLILACRYRIAAWRIVLPPMLASIFTLALLMLMLPGINLFHTVALFLVLGIGMDMGIFLTETRQAKQTWLAVTMSVATSLMAFGLLALSQTPVLVHFGLTVLLGLTFVWILATLFRQTHSGREF